MPTSIREVKAWDVIRITGKITSESGCRVENLVGTVSGSSLHEDGLWSIKVWPHDEKHPGLPIDHNGKLWFDETSTESIEILEREEDL